ncbi:TOM1-like protein 2 [Hordeum vulgare]|nr:TOM1-like protein 2 [Hordeum vulgare]
MKGQMDPSDAFTRSSSNVSLALLVRSGNDGSSGSSRGRGGAGGSRRMMRRVLHGVITFIFAIEEILYTVQTHVHFVLIFISSSGTPLSLSDLQRILSAAELLSEMLREVNPNDHEAVNDEIIAELVNQCRSYQKKIMSMVSSVRDEDLFSQSLDLNDILQILHSKHDAIASGHSQSLNALIGSA